MFAQLTSGLDFQANALIVRAERQRVIASNIANADTPGYRARDVNFKDAMSAARSDDHGRSGGLVVIWQKGGNGRMMHV